jgi:hypothetical protein
MSLSILLQSAIISAIVSFLGSIYLKKLEFNYSYRTFILENRKEAYKQVEKVISELYIKTNYTLKKPDGTVDSILEYEFLKDRPTLRKFYDNIVELRSYNFWLTKKMSSEIHNLYTLVGLFYAEHDKFSELKRESGIATFTDREDNFGKSYKALSRQYIKDIKELRSLNFMK